MKKQIKNEMEVVIEKEPSNKVVSKADGRALIFLVGAWAVSAHSHVRKQTQFSHHGKATSGLLRSTPSLECVFVGFRVL